MFDKVRFAVSSITKATKEKTISQNQLNEIMEEFEIQLLESEIAFDLVKKISDELKIEADCKNSKGEKFGNVTFSFELIPTHM